MIQPEQARPAVLSDCRFAREPERRTGMAMDEANFEIESEAGRSFDRNVGNEVNKEFVCLINYSGQ
ncbi:MAG: hypothetical protein ACYCY7_13200 [Gallionella sp.]